MTHLLQLWQWHQEQYDMPGFIPLNILAKVCPGSGTLQSESQVHPGSNPTRLTEGNIANVVPYGSISVF